GAAARSEGSVCSLSPASVPRGAVRVTTHSHNTQRGQSLVIPPRFSPARRSLATSRCTLADGEGVSPFAVGRVGNPSYKTPATSNGDPTAGEALLPRANRSAMMEDTLPLRRRELDAERKGRHGKGGWRREGR